MNRDARVHDVLSPIRVAHQDVSPAEWVERLREALDDATEPERASRRPHRFAAGDVVRWVRQHSERVARRMRMTSGVDLMKLAAALAAIAYLR